MYYVFFCDNMPTVKADPGKFNFAGTHYVQVSKSRVTTRPDSSKVLKRVLKLFIFCALLPGFFLVVPLYLRFRVYVQQRYPIGISDMRLIDKQISTTWCQRQLIETNTTFNAYVIANEPEISKTTGKINMRRSMTMQDGSKEYWGFYLLKESSFRISSCTRFPGASLIIIEGHHHLKECVYEGDKSSEENNDSASSEENRNITITDRMTKIMPEMTLYWPNDFKDDQINQTSSNEIHLTNNKTQNLHLRFAEESYLQKNKKKLGLRTNATKNIGKPFNFEGIRKDVKPLSPQINKKPPSRTNITNNKEEEDDFINIKNEIEINRKQKYLKEDLDDEDNVAAEVLDEDKIDIHGSLTVIKEGDRSKSEVWSSISSSEERILNCKGLLVSLPLIPNNTCDLGYDTNHLDKISRFNSIAYTTKSTGYYFFIFNNENEVNDNFLHAHFEINKKIYNVSMSVRECINETRECSLPLTFWSNEKTILELPKPNDDSLWNEEFIVVSTCEPRSVLYLICVIFIPVCIMLYAVC